MKVESFFFLGVTAFFVVIGVIYWFTSYEDAGTTLLAACALLGVVAGGFLFYVSRRIKPRPEDRPDAEIAEGAGARNEFPAASIWPFALAFGATALATGFVFGIWVILLGAVIFGLAAIGYVAESRRAG
jgi:Cytochrome c oxidase subunit IV